MLSEQEIWTLWNAQGSDEMNQAEAFVFARAILAAYQAKLLAGVEMPERYDCVRDIERNVTEDVFTHDQLQAYAAAAALNARREALDEAHAKCWELAAKYEKAHHPTCEAVADECADAIEALKGKV